MIDQAYTFAQRCENSDKILRKCISKTADNAFAKLEENNIQTEKHRISSSLRKIKRHDSIETKESPPIVQTENITIEDEQIKNEASEITNTEPPQENVNFDYFKLEKEDDDFSDSNDKNDDSDFCPDKSENEEEKPKETRKRSERKLERINKEENNWDDDFSWNADSPSDQKNVKAKKKRKGTPRRQGPPFVCKRCDITFQVLLY